MQRPDFWSDPISAQALIKELKSLKSTTEPYITLERDLIYALELLSLATEADVSVVGEIEGDVKSYIERLRTLETLAFFTNREDSMDALVSIHPGAGGVDAMEWAGQINRMYQRWLDKSGFKYTIIESQTGEAGIKCAVLEVRGLYAFGHLKSEIGVHRICHISDFDANHKKQTSFASVDVMPIYEDVNVDLKEADLEFETFRSGGPGGQGVNTTDSAVRVRHKPTGLFVKCQSQRSQLQNKIKALELLKSKVYTLELEKQAINRFKPSISFGNQIRTYVFEPYQLVVDHRTEYRSSNVHGILDGDVSPLIDAFLRKTNG